MLLLTCAVFRPTIAASQTGTYTFTSGQATDNGDTITTSEAGVLLTVSASDLSGTQGVDLTSLGCCGQDSDGIAAGNTLTSMTLTFAETVSVTTLRIINSQHHTQAYRFTANDGQTATSAAVASQSSATATLNFIGITSITIVDDDNTASFTGSIFIGMDDIALDASLPVELTTFDAVVDSKDVLLTWTTASEITNSGFAVEHQAAIETNDFENRWQELGFVEGHGTTINEHSYRYRADNLAVGTHRFRLKQVDYDGSFAYSPIVEVAMEVPQTYVLSALYPNPFHTEIRFTLALGAPQHVRISVHDLLGREVVVLHEGVLAGDKAHLLTLQAANWSSGVYMLHIAGEGFTTTQPLTLAK